MKENQILEFSFRPEVRRKNVFPLLFPLLAISGILVILSVQLERYKGVVSLAAVICVSICVYLYTKYVSIQLVYSVMIDSNNESMFLVNKVIGKRSTLMCSFYLSDIVCIEKFTKQTKNSYKPTPNAQKYNFTVSFGCDEFYVVKTKSALGSGEVVLECTDAVAERLRNYSEIAKAASAEE